MVWIVETKVFRHVIDRDGQFVEVPVRVRFEYGVSDGRYEPSTIEYEKLYNEGELLRRIKALEPSELASEIDTTIRRALDEEMRFAGLLPHGASLFDAAAEEPLDATASDEGDTAAVKEPATPEIIMPPLRTR